MAETIDTKKLNEIQGKIAAQADRDKQNENYFLGRNPFINNKRPDKPPDNRIPTAWGKMIVEDRVGYAARPGDIKIQVVSNEEGFDDGYPEIIAEILEYNDDNLNLSELYEDTLVFGRASEPMWLSDTDKISGTNAFMPEFKRVDSSGVWYIETNEIKSKTEAVYRFYRYNDIDYCEVYIEKLTETFKKGKQGWQSINKVPTPFSMPAMTKYLAGRNELAVFEAEKNLIDAHDVLISKQANEVDRFNALILLMAQEADKEFVDKLVQYMAIDGLPQDPAAWPQYLEKDLSQVEGFYNQYADRIERLIHKSSKTPDFTDENFAGNASGIAIAFKLLGFEFTCSMADAYFDRGIYQRIEMINESLDVADVPVDPSQYTINIKHQRNLPVDLKSKIEVAQILTGIVSRETLLKWLPEEIVSNVEKEQKLLKTEAKDRMKQFGDIMEGDDDQEEKQNNTNS